MIRYILLMVLTGPLYALTGFDVCNYGKLTIPFVNCNGPAILKETKVDGDINVTGSLQADSISVKSILVQGSTQISDSQVKGSVNITGDLSADHVLFSQGIAVTSTSAILNHSKVNGLVTMTSDNKNPYLQVLCGSVVTGSVLFDGKPGVVQVSGDSSVQGKIVNGSMEFVKITGGCTK